MVNDAGLITRLMSHQVQEQCAFSKAPPGYEGSLAVDPMMLDCTHLFRALEAGGFELSNSQTNQNTLLHHLSSSMTESVIFLRELTGMVGRPYRPTIIEEISWRDLILAERQRQAARVPFREEVVKDEVTGVVSTMVVPDDWMEEDSESERGSFGDLDQGVVLDESPVE